VLREKRSKNKYVIKQTGGAWLVTFGHDDLLGEIVALLLGKDPDRVVARARSNDVVGRPRDRVDGARVVVVEDGRAHPLEPLAVQRHVLGVAGQELAPDAERLVVSHRHWAETSE